MTKFEELTDQQVKDLEFKLAHGVLMTRDEWEHSIHLVNAITGRNDAISDEEFEIYAAEV